jgi:hypothetical protein
MQVEKRGWIRRLRGSPKPTRAVGRDSWRQERSRGRPPHPRSHRPAAGYDLPTGAADAVASRGADEARAELPHCRARSDSKAPATRSEGSAVHLRPSPRPRHWSVVASVSRLPPRGRPTQHRRFPPLPSARGRCRVFSVRRLQRLQESQAVRFSFRGSKISTTTTGASHGLQADEPLSAGGQEPPRVPTNFFSRHWELARSSRCGAGAQ